MKSDHNKIGIRLRIKARLKVRSLLTSMLYLILLNSAPAYSEQVIYDQDEYKVSLDGLFDLYYGSDFSSSHNSVKQFATQAIRNEQLNVNLVYLGSTVELERIKLRLAAQGGNSVDINYSSESNPQVRYLQEAYLGYSILDNLEIVGGIYLSHIGQESFISVSNINYQRSLIADYSPYYESGAKFIYKPDEDLEFQFHLLNGWQNITNNSYEDGDLGYGTYLKYQIDPSLYLMHATYVGNINYSSNNYDGLRIFNDLGFGYKINELTELVGSYDFGFQEVGEAIDNDYSFWNGFSVSLGHKLTEKLRLGTRVEGFFDSDNLIVSTKNSAPFKVWGGSLNVDYYLLNDLWLRGEVRYLKSADSVFDLGGDARQQNISNVYSLSYKF